MRSVIVCFIVVFYFSAQPTYAKTEIRAETLLYSVKDSDSLWMDKYDLVQELDSVKFAKDSKPAIIFMFGGGFVGGSRAKKSYIPYFNFLAENGFVVVSIDYRLGLRQVAKNKDITPEGLFVSFVQAVEVAVEDLFDATSFIVSNAENWNVNTTKIIANGSSAGAVSVLQGMYEISNKSLLTEKLPSGFNYAGVVSFAGAVLVNGEFSLKSAPCPILLFHGDADANVPYYRLAEMGAGLYGSKYIAEYLSNLNSPYWFWSVENAAHEIATSPMNENREEILSFINRTVEGKTDLMINTDVRRIGAKPLKKEFTIMDYIKSNFGK